MGTTFVKVLCAIDVGDRPLVATAETVLRAADREARVDGAALAVLHVLPDHPGSPMSPAGVEAQLLEREELASELIDSILEEVTRITGREPGDVTVSVGDGPAASAILDAAARTSADLIVVGHTGAKGLRQRLLGSVATAVVRDAPCSVLVVRTPM